MARGLPAGKGLLGTRGRWLLALFGEVTALAGLFASPAEAGPVALGEVVLEADRLSYTEAGDLLEAVGHVRLERQGIRIEGERLRYDGKLGTGSLTGPLRVTGGLFELRAASATFDLAAGWADVLEFEGTWARRGQVRGRRLHLSEAQIELEEASAAPCRHADPDLLLVARRFTFDPRTTSANVLMEGLSVRAANLDLLAVPSWRARLEEGNRPGFDGLLPALGFDLYQGLLSGTQVPFHLGPASLGTLDLLATSGRGLAAGLQHALKLPAGEVSNGVRYEAPWATGQGGLRVTNRYTWRQPEGGASLELAADYRANLNETAVHRLPEALAQGPLLALGPWLTLRPEARAGYLWEDLSGARALRARAALTATWNGWEPTPGWRTWAVATPWASHYHDQGDFLGAQVAWHARQQLGSGTALTQMLETVRLAGATPLIHDRLLPVDRLRLGVEHRWHPRFSTRAEGAVSRLFHEGDWLPEDLAVGASYQWNCFALDVTVRPLIGGFDTRFRLMPD